MANESLATDPETHGAPPVKGNYTTDAGSHLWCASALARVVASNESLSIWADDIQLALRHLLACEVGRARAAQAAKEY